MTFFLLDLKMVFCSAFVITYYRTRDIMILITFCYQTMTSMCVDNGLLIKQCQIILTLFKLSYLY